MRFDNHSTMNTNISCTVQFAKDYYFCIVSY